jgi:L-asparaginase/Glu-tRNA(Gln) amidotransferase subunit D
MNHDLPRSLSQNDTDRPRQRSSERTTPSARHRSLISLGINPRERPEPASTSSASEAKALQDKEAMKKTRQALNCQLIQAQKYKEAIEKTILDLNRQLTQAQKHKEATEKTILDLNRQLTQAQKHKEATEKTILDSDCKLTQAQKYQEATEKYKKAILDLKPRLNRVLQAEKVTEKTILDLNRQLTQAQKYKEAIEKTILDLNRQLKEINENRTRGEILKKNILVLFTGGTIGSVRLPDGRIVQPSEAKECGFETGDAKSLLLDEYQKRYSDTNIKFDTKILMETLSENMTIKKREDLTKQLKEIDFEKYDGIVLTHGSDTLGHTANYLSIILDGIKVPMILVSSNYVVTDERANGIENLKGAVDFISNVKLPGVYVTDNSINKGKTKVIYASRATQCKPITDNYGSTSIGEEGEKHMRPLGFIENGKFEVLDEKLFQKVKERSRVERKNLLDSIESLNSRVLVIHPYSGLNYDFFNLDKVDAILHTTYHSGTACTDDDSESENLLKFAEKCKEKGVDLYLGPIYGDEGRDVYSSTDKFDNSGGSTIMNVSFENALSKLSIAYTLFPDNKEERDKFIYKNINEELVKPASKLQRNCE